MEYHFIIGLIMALCFLLYTLTICIAIIILIRYFWKKGNERKTPPPLR